MNSDARMPKARYKKGADRENLDRLTISLTVAEREVFEKRARELNMPVSRLVVEAARNALGLASALPDLASITNAAVVAKQDEIMLTHGKDCEVWFFGANRLYLTQKVEIQNAWVDRLKRGTSHFIVWELGGHVDADEMGAFIETTHLIAERVKVSGANKGGRICHYAISLATEAAAKTVFEGMRNSYELDSLFGMEPPVETSACAESASLWGYAKLASVAFVQPKAGIGQGSVCFKALCNEPGKDAEELWRWLSNRESLILGHHLRGFKKRFEATRASAPSI